MASESLKLQVALLKPHLERSKEDIELLISTIVQMQFAKQRKLKERDCRELLSGMNFTKVSSQKDIITYGAESETYFVFLQGSAAVWQPLPNSEVRQVLAAFLK